MTLRVTEEALSDIGEASLWYDAQQSGLGSRIILEIDATLLRIEDGPLRYPVFYRGLRRALVRRFPYAVYFHDEQHVVSVLAVLHQRRDTKVLNERLGC